MRQRSKEMITIAIILAFLVGLFLAFIYIGRYSAEDVVKEYLNSSNLVKVSEESEYYFFDASGDNIALIFYPGGKVEETAYAKLIFEIAQSGIDCYIVKLPFRLAMFNANGADYIISNNNYKEVYVGGHSLGGVIAGNYAYENQNKVDGLVLIESRVAVKLDEGLKVLSVYATNDEILNKEKYENAKSNLPIDFQEVIIEGGNHSGLANYGEQEGDGIATISKEDQQEQTVKAIVSFIIK